MPHVPSRTMNQTAAALGQCRAAWGSTRRDCLTRLTLRFLVVTFERPRFAASWPVRQPLPVAPNKSWHYFLVMRLYHLCHPTCWWSHSHTFLRESAYNYSLWKRHKVAHWSCVMPTTKFCLANWDIGNAIRKTQVQQKQQHSGCAGSATSVEGKCMFV